MWSYIYAVDMLFTAVKAANWNLNIIYFINWKFDRANKNQFYPKVINFVKHILQQPLKKAYFIPGLGFNQDVIESILAQGLDIETINWIEPLINESIISYAFRMSDLIDNNQPITLIGHSFGGIIAQEISQIMDLDQIILISTCKSRAENSLSLKSLSPLKINKIIKKDLILKTFPLWSRNYGYETEDEMDLFKSMIKKCTDTYLSWALKSISIWQRNYDIDIPIIHIHGNKDRTFPIKNIKNVTHIIEGGNHFMIYKKAKEIAEILKTYLT